MSDKDRIGSYAKCSVCGQDKCPRGRSAPMGHYLCDMDCPGYSEPPLAGDLWPGESAEDFGYPCQTTEERNKVKGTKSRPPMSEDELSESDFPYPKESDL